jgi:hypothetical protein
MKTIIVVGLGLSARQEVPRLQRAETIGVNDVDYFLHPKHLLLLDKPQRFKPTRLETIKKTKAKRIYYIGDRWDKFFRRDKRVQKFEILTWRSDNPADLDEAPWALVNGFTSPFTAVHLAYKLGAKRIGVIGVDLIGHQLAKYSERINKDFYTIWKLLQHRKVALYNCSKRTMLEKLPFRPLKTLVP